MKARLKIIAFNCLCVGQTVLCASTIHGFVSDYDNRPFTAAQVELVTPFLAGNPIAATTKTDSRGYYEFTGISPGEYQLFASKPEAGYGDPLGSFFAAGHPTAPELTVKSSDEMFNVNIDVGQPGGFLKASVIDEESKTPLPVGVKITLVDDPAIYLSFSSDQSGHFDTTIPALPINVSVSAPGYQAQTIAVSVGQKEHKELTFRLKKSGS